MTLIHCPPWRKPRPASPSEVARSYQASQTCDSETQQRQIDDPRAKSGHSPSSHAKYHPGGISRILRRRFSRESRASSAHHEASKFVFPFPRKPSKSGSKPATELGALGGYGSSLVSESRYDSDAQFISTPGREPVDSPANRVRRRMELSDLIERSQEHRESERWALGLGDNIPEPPESIYGLRFIRTPPSSIRSHRGPNSRIPGNVSFQSDQVHAVNSATTLPNLNTGIERRNTSNAGPSASTQNLGRPIEQRSPPGNQSVEASTHNDLVNSLVSASNQPSDLVIAKRRQRTDSGMFLTDDQSVYLEDMGISQRLASQSASSVPVSCNPSIAELVRNDRYGIFVNSSQENMPTTHKSTVSITSARSPRAPILHHQGGSSHYSRQPSSLSANASPRSRSLALDAENHSATAHGSEHSLARQETHHQKDTVFMHPALGSRFHEHCETDGAQDSRGNVSRGDTTTIQAQRPDAPRKVSVGWMSGGRRVGYGYSPVSDGDGAQCQYRDYNHANLQAAMFQNTEAGISEANVRGSHQNQMLETDLRECPPEKHHTAHTEVDPASAGRVPSHNPRTNEYLAPPYLQAILKGDPSLGYDGGPELSEKRSIQSLGAMGTHQTNAFERDDAAPQRLNASSKTSDTALHRWARLSQSLNSNPQQSKKSRGHRAGVLDSVRREQPQEVRHPPRPSEVDIDPDYLGIEHDFSAEDIAHLIQPSNSRGTSWIRRLSRRSANKVPPNTPQKEESRNSLGLNRASSSLERADSTKSVGANAEELASMYQECLNMPGSFEGSRWASRTSRLLWELVTMDDR